MYARYVPPPKSKAPQVEASSLPHSPPPPPPLPAPIDQIAPSVRTSSTPYARYIPPKKPSSSSSAAVIAPTPAPALQPRKIVFNDEDFDSSAFAVHAKPKRHGSDDESEHDRERRKKKAKTRTEHPEQRKNSLREGEDVPRKKKEKKKKESASKTELVKDGEQSQEESKVEKGGRKSKANSQDVLDDEPPSREPMATGKEEKTVTEIAASSNPVTEKKDKKKNRRNSEAENHEVVEKDEDLEMTDAPDLASAEVENKVEKERHKSVLKKKEKALKKATTTARSAAGGEDQGDELHAPQPGHNEEEAREATEVLHGLEPLPQPAPVTIPITGPAYDTLPGWLANPVLVPQDTKAPWTSLGIRPEMGISQPVADALASKGFGEAFAVQTAVIPRLLPNPGRQGDLVISAATGSGKTLAYVLPLVRDVSLGCVTKLRAVIVVPTRELVRQVQEVCETCTSVFAAAGGPERKRVKVGVAVGNQAFGKEQELLVEEELRYDPAAHRQLVESRGWAELRRREVEDPDFDMLEILERPVPLAGHVVEHASRVDVLICTPGRLVEHMERTPGFTLEHVRWLVVDEADKLLEQSFQQWLELVMGELSVDRAAGARDFPRQNKSGVRKVMLSATMTRNVSLLAGLRLSRPELIVLEGGSKGGGEAGLVLPPSSTYELALPELLQESAIKVRDPSQKPLYLVDLLNSAHMRSAHGSVTPDQPRRSRHEAESDTSSSGSDSDSDSNSEPGSGTSDESGTSSGSEDGEPAPAKLDTVLIFTKSNETALRLSRLLEMLCPRSLSTVIGTLTSTTRTSERRKVLRAFQSGRVRVLVASDLVARGLDLAGLDHVVNYDMPPSVRSYVHRVGRTARAGRPGRAWTFFNKAEAGWFFAKVAGQEARRVGGGGGGGGGGSGDVTACGTEASAPIRRSGKVETMKVTSRRSAEDMESGGPGDFGYDRVAEYERALEALGREARELREK